MSENRKGKFALSGLGKGSSSGGAFRSFRFSPENEEIEEIMLQDPTADDKSRSQPGSPKPSAGEVSPLKEILKHKLANKLEKRSLSFDSDLKGKLMNVFEDKRKSIVSHFIQEETGIIPPATSIAEHIGYAGDADTTSSGSIVKNISESNEAFLDLTRDFEEVGTDYLANSTLHDETHLEQVLKFAVSPDYLQEYFGGYSPIYYQHPRQCNELPLSDGTNEINSEDLNPANILKNILSALVTHEWTKYLLCLIAVALFLPFGTKYISPFLWVFAGGLAVIIFQDSLFSPHPDDSDAGNSADSGKSTVVKPKISGPQSSPSSSMPSVSASIQSVETPKNIISCNFHSQGWMTEFDGEYDPFTCNVRLPRIVFVRLEGSMLYISYPHPKHRIPKRRLWNDPQITVELTFLRHCVYNLAGATVSIAPEGLSKKRAWNKKYPIAIRLANPAVMAIVSPSSSTDGTGTGNVDSNTSEDSTSGAAAGAKKTVEQKKEITQEDCSHKTMYLFSRTDREKDDWFRRFIAATKSSSSSPGTPESQSKNFPGQDSLKDYLEYMQRIIPSSSTPENSTTAASSPAKKSDKKDKSHGLDKDSADKSESSSNSSNLEESPASSRKGTPIMEDSAVVLEKMFSVPQKPDFLNALLGRIFYDFLRTPYWKSQVNDMIQKKLNYIRKPQFLETLVVRDLDLGSTIPIIQRASNPVRDSQGVWIDLDLSYDGNIVVTLETKINLLKLRKSPSQETPEDSSQSHNNSSSLSQNSVTFSNTTDASSVSMKKTSHNSTSSLPGTVSAEMSGTTVSSNLPTSGSASGSGPPLPTVAHNMFDSEADDSGESSEDEINSDEILAQGGSDSGTKDDSGESSKGKKILKMAEKIAMSKYVQQATEMKVVKKAIANVANTPIVLAMELKCLNGTLALNIPPPPTDRLWMGFRHNPSMQISAKPKFGSRAVNLTHVTDWIQKKLLHEFQRVIVFPNMNDVTIPLMEFKLPN